MNGKVALITGGNGITGSAILEHLCRTKTPHQWAKFIVTSRSPFVCNVQDPRIEFIALDFNTESSSLAHQMRKTCSQVTHAYFSSYAHHDDFGELARSNQSLFENFLEALTQVARHLENVTLQTGGKYYSLHVQPVPHPARESNPRAQQHGDNFYYAQEDFLKMTQQGKKWSYNIIRPQAIIGSTPKPNGMNQALTLALYFLVCKKLGQPAPMPTNQRFWGGVDEMSYAPLIADLTIYVSTNTRCANEAFNMVNGDVVVWRYLWPELGAYFGVECSPQQEFRKILSEGDIGQELTFVDWAKDKESVWKDLCEESHALKAMDSFQYGTWGYQDWVFQRSWSSLLSMSKARKYGWNGYKDTYECLIDTFETFKKEGLIPS